MITSQVFARSTSEASQAPSGDIGQEKESPAPGKVQPGPSRPRSNSASPWQRSQGFRGYTLLNPMNKRTAYLIDMEGRVVKSWESEHSSPLSAYLLENGHLLPGGDPERRASLWCRPVPGRADPGVRLGWRAGVGLYVS